MKKNEFVASLENMGFVTEENIDYRGVKRLSIKKDNERVSPSIKEEHLNEILERMESDEDVKDLVENMFNGSTFNSISDNLDKITSAEYILDNVYPVLLPKTKEVESKDVIYEEADKANDLMVVYKVKLNNMDFDSYQASYTLQHNHLKATGLQLEEVKLKAVENFRREVSIVSMFDTLKAILNTDFLVGMEEDPTPGFMVVSHKISGAYGLNDEYTLNRVCDILGTDSIAIIPSSIWECLVLDVKDLPEEDINEMINDINATQLPPSEVLSNHVYRYSR